MSAADEAARLREQADALDVEAKLEAKLRDAKGAYRDNLDDAKAKARLDAAKRALVEARRARRPSVVTIGGDAIKEG